MSWPDALTPWAAGPAPAVPLRNLVLGALAEAFVTRRAGPSFCADCDPGRPCADHREDLAAAGLYETAYMRIRGIGSDGAMLTLIGGLA